MGTQQQDPNTQRPNQPGKPGVQNPGQSTDRPHPQSGQDKGKDMNRPGQGGQGSQSGQGGQSGQTGNKDRGGSSRPE